ncbi:dTMP kinase [Oceaniserpentilla sp. 4NH20-0058]|uniref:dTMP kinase n=1 Tax=Oceaniserpentilla sp. 4NH20-0058 TaxID=3127660 RepID=UPI003105B2BC
MKGCFITIEGIEGVGKTTNLKFIQAWLEKQGIEYISTREPGGTDLGERLRELLLHGGDVSSEAELLMMFASRSQHLEKLIKPAIDQGKWVICDRFTDSTYAYQGGGRQMNLSSIESLETLVHKNVQPDLTLLLDAPVEIGRERAAKRSAADRIEAEDLAFFNRVRDMFLARAKQYDRFKVIDATQSLEDVQTNIETSLEHLLQRESV